MRKIVYQIFCLLIFTTSVWGQCDWNNDSQLDIIDIVQTVACILDQCYDGSQCDWNGDSSLDILDIVQVVDCILTDCWSNLTMGCTDPEALNFVPEALTDDGSCVYPIAHWDFDQLSGNILEDVSGNGHDGLITNATWVEIGGSGALHFMDTSHVTIPYSPDLQPNEAITLEALVWFDQIHYDLGIPILSTNHGGGYGLRNYNGNLDIYLNINNVYQTAQTLTGFSAGQWLHLAGTFNGSMLRFYLNGTLMDELEIEGEITYAFENDLQIGRDASGGSQPEGNQFNGFIDEIRISPIALEPWQFLTMALEIAGCTDPQALNYDPLATIDDGSCLYDVADFDRDLTILYTNDEHGWLLRENETGGGAELMGQWREIEGYTEEGSFLIISGGDNWTGPAISTWFQGESMVEVMNAMQYSAAAIGNHEFDFGLDVLSERLAQANFPYLSANMISEDTGEQSPLVPSYIIQEVNDIQVGIIGLTAMEADDINFPQNVENIDFDEYETVLNDIVPEVEAAGAELLLITSHMCLSEITGITPLLYELGVTLIGGGHCHSPAALESDGVSVILGGSNMNGYAKAVIEFNTYYDVVNEITISNETNTGLYVDEDVAAVVSYWNEILTNDLSEVIGYLENEVGQSDDAMFNLITDSWLQTYPADISITNRGGIRQPMPAGDVTFETWVGILPFENFIVEIELTGQQLVDNIGNNVVGGMTTIPYYMLADGTPLDMEATYTVLLTDYIYATSANFLELDPTPYETSIHWRQPVIDWINSLNTNQNDPLDNYLDYLPRQ